MQGEKCQDLALIVTSHDFNFTMAIFFILGFLINIDQIHPNIYAYLSSKIIKDYFTSFLCLFYL